MNVASPHQEYRLATYGWLPWAQATHLLGDIGAVWLDSRGVVERTSATPWSAELPATARIHAWNPSVGENGPSLLWRLIPRPAAGTALVTALASFEPPGSPVDTRPVDVELTRRDRWERLWVVELAAIAFLRPASGQ